MAKHGWIATLLVLSLAGGARAEGTEHLLEILELHEKLATNEAFLQQAKLLGAYLEAAESLDHDRKVVVYRRVLGILREIEKAPAKPAAAETPAPAPAEPPAPAPAPAEPPAAQTAAGALDAGAARLEWYEASSLDAMPDVPVKTALWTRDLLVMDEELPPAPESASAARISFLFEAGASGEYVFSAQHGRNDLRIVVGGKRIVDLAREAGRTGKGSLYLERGYHQVDVFLRHGKPGDASFAVTVLPPGAKDSRVVTKADLLLRRPAP